MKGQVNVIRRCFHLCIYTKQQPQHSISVFFLHNVCVCVWTVEDSST